jgi:hypothetical protein
LGEEEREQRKVNKQIDEQLQKVTNYWIFISYD